MDPALQATQKAWIKSEVKRGQRAAVAAIGLGATQVLCGIGQTGCAALLLAAVLGGADLGRPRIALLAGLFLLLAAGRAILLLIVERLGFERGAAARRRLRNGVLGALLALGPAGLAGRHSAELAATAIDGVEVMEGLHARWIPATALAALGPLLVGLAALAADWRAGLILGLAGLAVPVAMAAAGIGAGAAAKSQFVAMTRLQIRFLDRIRGISTIVLAGRAAGEARNLAEAATELRVRTMRVLRVAFLSSTALDLAAAAALVLIVLRFAGSSHGAIFAATPLFLLLLVPEFFAPLRAFSAVYQDRLAVEAVAGPLAALPAAPLEIPPVDIRSVAAQGLTLAFDDVSFAHDPARPVLEHLSFRVGANEILLLTGASGTGKSTIIDLVLGFIVQDAGRITINNAPLPTLIPAARARMVGWIGQKPMLFAGTIADNIRFARPEAGEDDLAEAVRLARLTELVASLPEGLETPIGEGGFGLSGGQAQRVAIARAFLKNAPLLLLDEPTAHLDPAAEREIFAAIRRLAIGRTVLLASHAAQAAEFARDAGARRLDLDALRHARLRGVA